METFNSQSRCEKIEEAVTQLRRVVMLYRYPDGSKLTELMMAERYACSRAVVLYWPF